MRTHRRVLVAAVLGLTGVLLVAILAVTLAMVAPGTTIRIEVDREHATSGGSFGVRLVQDAPAPTIGTQASVTFDHTKAQISSVGWGEAFAEAQVHVPTDLSAAVSHANETGELSQIAAAFLPPSGVPAGSSEFLVIDFTAVSCGRVDLGLPVGPLDAAVLDGREATSGVSMPVSTAGATVTIDCPEGAPAAVGGSQRLVARLASTAILALALPQVATRGRQGPNSATSHTPH